MISWNHMESTGTWSCYGTSGTNGSRCGRFWKLPCRFSQDVMGYFLIINDHWEILMIIHLIYDIMSYGYYNDHFHDQYMII